MHDVARTTEASARPTELRTAAAAALRRRANWIQLFKFCAVGATGYAINLGVYTILVHVADIHYIASAAISFVVAVTNNYALNRLWTFRHERGHVGLQGAKFLAVSLGALGANLGVLAALVAVDVPKVPAQAAAIVIVTPLSFLGNKLWSFRQ